MATQECARCGSLFVCNDSGATGPGSVLMIAPTVPDKAAQALCPKCQYLFVESEARRLRWARVRAKWVLAFFALLVLVTWAGHWYRRS